MLHDNKHQKVSRYLVVFKHLFTTILLNEHGNVLVYITRCIVEVTIEFSTVGLIIEQSTSN